jgi:hypothetical protein
VGESGRRRPNTELGISKIETSARGHLGKQVTTDLYTRVKVGPRLVVLPGRPPATDAAMRLAPAAGWGITLLRSRNSSALLLWR